MLTLTLEIKMNIQVNQDKLTNSYNKTDLDQGWTNFYKNNARSKVSLYTIDKLKSRLAKLSAEQETALII